MIPDKGCEAYCLLHRRRVRWLPAPMWWHHADDRETCWRLLGAKAPWKTP
jgi:hypothetical protein